ncbi:DUF2334 domain-containing protein [Candidatus Thorarchaeota archaeon]|nr:MAG: DUF2334 domain-containing protein [Candidatus Thorarchaeota archaeon]
MSHSSYLGQLTKRWGLKAPKQLLRMMRLHRTPFQIILQNMFQALEEGDGQFTFPTIAGIAKMRPELVREIVREGHEVASHGYNHVRYPTLSAKERERDFALSLQTYRKLGIDVKGFRAPYDRYTDDMPLMLEKYKIVWDGGFGYRSEHREKEHFFNVDLNGQPSKVTYIPLNIWSDDFMIDGRGMGPEEVTRTLKDTITQASKTQGVIMFDLHPIRMGQAEFVGCLRDICIHANSIDAWCTTPSEAVSYWNTHKKWKGDRTFCLLLTGDIDNWVFSDYLRRVIWKRESFRNMER